MKLWIARDKKGFLGLYREKPIWKKHSFLQIEDWFDAEFLSYLNPNDFPEFFFENSPQQVELKLVDEK